MLKGLLDTLNSEEGQLGLAMLAAAGPQAQPMSFGQRLAGVMSQQQARKQAEEDRKLKQLMTSLQMDELLTRRTERQDAIAEKNRTRERTNQFYSELQPKFTTSEEVLANGGGLTPENASRVGQPKPLDLQRLALQFPDQLPTIKALAEAQNFGVQAPIKLGAGDVLLDPKTRQPIFTAPNKPAEAPGDVRQYQFAVEQGYKGSFVDFQKELKRAGASTVQVQYGAPVAGQDAKGNPIFFQPSKDGGAPAIIPGVAPQRPDKPLTEAQAKAQTFFGQMTTAENFYRENDLKPDSLPSQVAVSMAGGNLNFAAPATAQKARQAQDQWSEAFLRFKTGAASTKDEVAANNRTFFPVIGDSPEVIEQKRLARESAMRDIQAAATGKAGEVPELREPKGQTSFKMLPPANQYPGKRMRADNGTIYRSDGTRWVQE